MGRDKPYPTECCTFVVIDVEDLTLRYNGKSLFETAEALIPGTCYGYALETKDALAMAVRTAERSKRSNRLARMEHAKKIA